MSNNFGPYRLLRRIASGGMGEVYLAVLEREGGFSKNVALKRLLPPLQCHSQWAQMFEAEAAVAALLNHANIVQVFDHGCIDSQTYLTMEFVEGPDLAALLGACSPKPFPPQIAAEIGIQISRALAHAHERRTLQGKSMGVIHGDVSPSNILITLDGQVKLTDFGLARLKAAAEADGMLVGKYSYMSPEQASAQPLIPESDLFSLGVVLFELFLGRRAFPLQDPPSSTIEAIRRGKSPAPASLAQSLGIDLPRGIAEFLERALAQQPAHRFSTAAKMAEALVEVCPAAGPEKLSSFVRQVAPAASLPAHSVDKTEVAQKPVRAASTGKTRWVLLSLGLLLLTGLAYWIFRGPPPSSDPLAAPRPLAPKALSLQVLPQPVPSSPTGSEVRTEDTDPKPINKVQPVVNPGQRPDSVPMTQPVTPAPMIKILAEETYQAQLDHQPVAGNAILISEATPHYLQLLPRDGKKPEVSLRLHPPRQAGQLWRITLHASPWMHVRINGHPTGQTPRTNIALPLGRTQMKLDRDGNQVTLDIERQE